MEFNTKQKILALFNDVNLESFFHEHNYEREKFIKALCFFLNNLTSTYGVLNIRDYYYYYNSSYYSYDFIDYNKNFIFVISVLNSKFPEFKILKKLLPFLNQFKLLKKDQEDYLTYKSIDLINKIEDDYIQEVEYIIDKVINIILNEELHPNIIDAFPNYKTFKLIKNF
jgi:hypothetical protein